MSEAEKKARATRIPGNAIIRMGRDGEGKAYGADNNPRGSKTACGQRFPLYKDGQTVDESRAAGHTAADIRSDVEKGYIVIEESAEVKQAA